jgi:hypothetical protein
LNIGGKYTNPQIFYIPKHKYLGEYNDEYGGELYMIEERPEEAYTDERNFGYADDIESTYDIIEKVREDEKYKIDENAYIRARLFDMLVGDWDRHQDQWRWAQFNQENGDKVYKPIPRDRDQVFSNFDGTLLDIIRFIAGSARQLQVYDSELKDVKWMNSAGVKLDRVVIQQSELDAWIKQAKFLEDNVTDEVIDRAFKKIPEAVQDSIISDIKIKLKGRRGNLQDIATRYYNYLNELVVLTGTDKDDYIEVTRIGDGLTNVKISRLKDGGISEPFIDRTYDHNITKELWIYGLDDDDIFIVKGRANNSIFTRLIGGQGNDTYNILEGQKIKVYDHKSKKNTVLAKNGARFKFTDVYTLNLFNYEKNRTKGMGFNPSVGYNPDDGILLGIDAAYTVNGFQRNPFSQQHAFTGIFAFETSGFELDYEGEFANFFFDWNLNIGGKYTNPMYTNNFFGFGNETINFVEDFDYNRVRKSIYAGHIGILKHSPFGSDYGFRAVIEGIQIQDTENRFISDLIPLANDEFFKRKYFGAIEAEYDYLSTDNKINPSKAMKFFLNVGAKTDFQDLDKLFGYINSNIEFYNSLTKNKRFVLRTDLRTQLRIGGDFEFYQAANIGGDTGLRGYRNERFTGRNSLVAGADFHYYFPSFKTRILPIQIGIFSGGDVGRVWLKGDFSGKWHNDYGGGIRITAAESLSGTVRYFVGEDGSRLAIGFGLKF